MAEQPGARYVENGSFGCKIALWQPCVLNIAKRLDFRIISRNLAWPKMWKNPPNWLKSMDWRGFFDVYTIFRMFIF
jgi:hypothetical protein